MSAKQKRTKGKICKSKIVGSLFDAVGCWENNGEQKFGCSCFCGVMSEPRTRVAAGSPQFCELWRNVSKLYNKTRDKTAGTAMSPVCNDLQSPRPRGDSKYLGSVNGDSPGDTEASQDIFWDSTSPTQAAFGRKNTRVMEISDIVNRIAPKDIKPKERESSLLQWIDDSTIPYTPENQKPRVRKRSSRQSSVEALMKLARQFDRNMQQDEETSEHLNIVNNNLGESETRLTDAAFSSTMKDLRFPSSLDQAEAELHALFDCSTQGISGRLSEGSASSQDTKDQPATLAAAERQQLELKSADKCDSTSHPAKQNGTCSYATNSRLTDDFDDDWENDDLLNDSFVLEMTQNPDVHLSDNPKTTFQSKTKTNTKNFTSACKQSVRTDSPHQPADLDCRASCSALQELCTKPKTTNRSTFKLASNPHFKPTMTEEDSKPSFTVIQPKSRMTDQKPVTTKTCSHSQPSKGTGNQASGHLKAPSVRDISDSLWDDGDDDALLYQVCDSVERISNSQQIQASSRNCHETHDCAAERQQKSSKPLPVEAARCVTAAGGAKRQPPRAFVRSHSLQETSCETANYRGWNIPMKGTNDKSRMSQSFPGSHMGLHTCGQWRDSSGNFQAGNGNVDVEAHTVTARAPRGAHLSAFKRNLSDSAITGNKVFVSSQKTGKCSAAEIERKKQEALARRRLRMQNTPKPS